MRRIRLRTGPAALFGAIFVAALIVFLPMRLVLGWIGLGDLGLTARQVTGSMWFGSLTEARAAGFVLGDMDAHVSPIQLLVGRAKIDVAGKGRAPLQGAASVSRHGFGVDDVSASLAGGAAFAPLPVTSLDLDDVSARFKDGACDHAEGRVRATLGGALGGVPLPQAMAGTARCDGNALLLPLVSTAGTESLDVRFHADGSYAADLTMRTGDPALGTKLQLAGFQPSANGFLLSVQGRI
ncbi:type II secretion system protein N [Hephaestia mangrovi]|uniref:type II secretion system protein N n=1 Tax=Hephaestia mangrovi TaxID=2873268 RepID=UPI001CA73FB6|nr:type II secretion system protein N [Hephaestia mangrovi]MBY8827541.1 type II secretion system protein N [Hephaestia mangrovi]